MKQAFIESWFCVWSGERGGGGEGGGTFGKILAIAWVFFLASSLITQVGNMFVKIQLFHQDFFENPSLLFWKWVAKSLCLCQDCTRKKHTYWLTSILFLWYHLKSLTEVLGNYFLVHIGFFSYTMRGLIISMTYNICSIYQEEHIT